MCHDASKVGSVSSLIDKADIIGIGPGLGTLLAESYYQALASEKHLVQMQMHSIFYPVKFMIEGIKTRLLIQERQQVIGFISEHIQSDRINSITEISNKYSANVLLKGNLHRSNAQIVIFLS